MAENEHTAENDRRQQVMDVLAAHDTRAQNIDGDWLCACGSFLCVPNDDRLDTCHREHLATILTRRVFPPAEGHHLDPCPHGYTFGYCARCTGPIPPAGGTDE